MKTATDHFGFRVDSRRDDVVYLCVDRHGAIPTIASPLITWDLRTEAEVDNAVSLLQGELKEAGKRAKSALRKRRRGKAV